MNSDYKKFKNYHEPLLPTKVSIYKQKEGFTRECNSKETEYCKKYNKNCMIDVNNEAICDIGTPSTYQNSLIGM